MVKKILYYCNIRIIQQIVFTILINPFFKGFYNGTIYQGPLKKICVPVLNCYSCPGAVVSCPIGTLQHMLVFYKYHFSFLLAGIIAFFGGIAGRWFCGHACPFGLFQDLLMKLRRKKLSMPRYLSYSPWIVFILFILILPFLLQSPAFCKYVCPQGALQGGVILPLFNTYSLGILYVSKMVMLVGIIIASILIARPFCRFICPLGLLLGLCNKVSLFQMRVNKAACIECDACLRACPTDVSIYKKPDSIACIRCGECISVCPKKCITFTSAKEDTYEKSV